MIIAELMGSFDHFDPFNGEGSSSDTFFFKVQVLVKVLKNLFETKFCLIIFVDVLEWWIYGS